jgi:ferric-dicitrate binding protein FerR (iron transport regulator)
MNNRCWFLLSKKLSGIATDPELSELDDYLQEHPEWQYSVEQVGRIWETNDSVSCNDDDFHQHLTRMERNGVDTAIFSQSQPQVVSLDTGGKRKWLAAILVAASIIAAIAMWFMLRPSPQLVAASGTSFANTNVIVTEKADRRKMVLPDGTQVWLNAESKLEYSPGFGKSNRQVTLSGEAYFDVVKNTDLPFTIETNKIHIKVTGTAFNVRAYPGEKISETSIIRGKVEVTVNARPDEKYILKRNEKLVVRDEPVVYTGTSAVADKKPVNAPLIQVGYVNYVENDSAAVETSWVYDRLVFDEESMENIALKMERWYGVKIKITDPQLAAQQLTYTIKKETVSQALHNMQYALRFHYSINGELITITR